MKFNLTKPFDGAMQSVPERDPWDGAVTFHIRPIFFGPFQRALREDAPKRATIMQRALAKVSKKMALAAAPIPAPTVDGAEPEPPAEFNAIFRDAYQETVEETPEADFASMIASSDEALPADKVALLVEAVDGLIDADTNEACGIEAIADLLADTSIVPPRMRYAGMEAGWALRLWIVERSRAAAAALAEMRGAVEKNSESSSGSDLPSSGSSSRTSETN